MVEVELDYRATKVFDLFLFVESVVLQNLNKKCSGIYWR